MNKRFSTIYLSIAIILLIPVGIWFWRVDPITLLKIGDVGDGWKVCHHRTV